MDDAYHLHPKTLPFRQAVIAVTVFMTPVFITLYVLSVPSGPWRLVLAMQILTTVAVALAAVAYFRVGIWVSREGMRERGYFGRTADIPISEIGSTILAKTFAGDSTESLPQLFVRAHDGHTLVRMRGEFWSRENMDLVVATLEVPHESLDNAVSREELRSDYPGLLYWFERRPVIAALAFTALVAAFGALVLLGLNLLGISAN